MKLLSLQVSHWRRFRSGPHRIEFGPRGTLVHGANETGKSTLFQALRHALFDRPSGTAKWLKALPSYGSGAMPRVRLEFELAGRHLAVEKTFGNKGTAELSEIRGGHGTTLAQGTEAAERLAGLLGAEFTKGPAKASQWGAFQWLFMPQEPDLRSLPRIHGAAFESLGMEGAATSDLFEAVARRVADEVGRHYAEKRKSFKKQSDITRLRGELERLEASRRDLLRQRADLAETLARHEDLARDLPRLREAVIEAETLFAQAMERLGARAAENRELPRRKEELDKSQEELRQAEEALARRRAQTDRVERLQEELDAVRGLEIDARVAFESLEKEGRLRREDMDRANRERTSAQDRLKSLRPKLETWKDGQRLHAIEARRAKISALTQRMAQMREQLSGPAPGTEDMERIHAIAVKLEVARSDPPTLHVLRDDGDMEVLLDGNPLEGDEGSARLDVVVRIPGREGAVRIRRDDDAGGISELEASLQRELEAFGVQDRAALVALAERRRETEQKLRDLEAERRGLLVDATTEDLDREAELLRARLEGVDVVTPEEGERLAADVRDLEHELEGFDTRVQELAAALTAWTEERAEKHAMLQDAREKRKTLEVTHAEARRHLDGDRDRAGSTSKLEGDYEEAKARVRKNRERYERLRDEAEERRRGVEVAVTTAKRRMEAARERLRDAEQTLATLADRLDRQAAQGLGTRLDEVERRIEEETERLARLERRAAAALHLEDLMDAVRRETFAAVTAPVRRRTAEYLAFVTTGRYDEVALGDDLHPASLAGMHHALERYDDGSEGLRELTNVLLRVAVAVALSGDGPQTLVLDDPCVHVSGRRTRRLVELFNRLMAEYPLQLVLFTHRPEEFDGLDAIPVDIEKDLASHSLEEDESFS